MDSAEVSTRVDHFFNQTNLANMSNSVAEFYHPQATFKDPIVSLEGRDALVKYYSGLYENIETIHFEIQSAQFDGKDALVLWEMKMKHRRLNGGDEIQLPGTSHFRFDEEKVIYHRDFFDVSSMVYEHVPVLGWFMNFMKNQLAH